MKKLILFSFILLFIGTTEAQQYKLNNINTELEEKFIYGVSWEFFHLGTIELKIERIIDNPKIKKITMDIESAAFLPFINIEEHHEAVMRLSDGMTLDCFSIMEDDGIQVKVSCNYNVEENYAVYKVSNFESDEVISEDTLTNNKPFLIGVSLFYYTRLIADFGLEIDLPTLVDGNIYNTSLNFCGPVEYISIDGFEKPIRVLKYSGLADWNGQASAGLSGEFDGWLSDEDDGVVVKSEMNIFLGLIIIELEEWQKLGWEPPTSATKILTNYERK